MLLGLLFLIALIVGGYFLGRRHGRTSTEREIRKRNANSWQEGYDAAMRFRDRQSEADQPHGSSPQFYRPAPPATPGVPTLPPTHQQGETYLDATAHSNDVPSAAAEVPASYGYRPAGSLPFISRVPNAGPEQSVPAGPVPQAMAPSRAPKVLTKRERELRNINITLYVAALMIVAAGALFLSFALPPMAKLVSLFILAAAFYVGGLVVHSAKPSLRPAAAAFAGTGLALLPLSAIATYNTLNVSGASVWLVFSTVATIAVGYATVRFRSRVLAWLAVLILVSTAMAGAATMQRGVFYYLLALLLLSIILLLAAVRSQTVRSSLFFDAAHASSQLLPVMVLALALILGETISDVQLLWVFALTTAQLLLTLRLIVEHRMLRMYGSRLTGMLTVYSAAQVLDFSTGVTAAVLAAGFALQGMLVVLHGATYRRIFGINAAGYKIERGILWALSLLAGAGAALFAGDASAPWMSYLLIPALMAGATPALWRRAKIEALAVLLFALLAILAAVNWPWRALISLGLAAVLFNLLVRRSANGLASAYALCRWALLVLVTAHLAQSAAHLFYDGSDAALFILSILGAGLAAAGLWIWDLSHRDSARLSVGTPKLPLQHLCAALDTAILLGGAMALRYAVHGEPRSTEVFGLRSENWCVVVLLAVCLMLIASGLRWASGKADRQQAQAVRWAVLVGLGLTYVSSFWDERWVLAVVVAVLLIGYLLYVVHGEGQGRLRIAHAGAAQLVFSSASWWFVHQVGFDVHGQFAFVLTSLIIPQILRLIYSRSTGAELRAELRWIAVAIIIGAAAATAAYAVSVDSADRGVLLLSTVLVGCYGVAAYIADGRAGEARQFYLFAPLASLILGVQLPAWNLGTHTGWIRSTWWSAPTALWMLIIISATALIAEWLLRRHRGLSYLSAAGVFLPLLVVAGWDRGLGWVLICLGLATIACALLVHTRRIPWFALAASLGLWASLRTAVSWWREAAVNAGPLRLDTLWILLGATLLAFFLAAAHGRFAEERHGYPTGVRSTSSGLEASRLYFAAMLAFALMAGLWAHLSGPNAIEVVGGAALIFAAALTIRTAETPPKYWHLTVDVLLPLGALLALTSYARLAPDPELNQVAAYFSVVAVVLAALKYRVGAAKCAWIYVISAGVLANLVMAANLAEHNTLTGIYSLIVFAGLIALGLKTARKAYIWWGAVTITVAVLWSLRSLAFLWLVILGAALIVVAVLRLVRVEPKPDEQPTEPGPGPKGPEGTDIER